MSHFTKQIQTPCQNKLPIFWRGVRGERIAFPLGKSLYFGKIGYFMPTISSGNTSPRESGNCWPVHLLARDPAHLLGKASLVSHCQWWLASTGRPSPQNARQHRHLVAPLLSCTRSDRLKYTPLSVHTSHSRPCPLFILQL